MTEQAGPVLRGLRAALLAAATLWVACWAHASANGNLPGWPGLVVLWLLLAPVVRREGLTMRAEPVEAALREAQGAGLTP